MSQRSLFETYPGQPGFKGQPTSKAAAEGIAPLAGTMRARVLAALRAQPDTPEGVAGRLGLPLMNVRPRCSELHADKLIEDSGVRRTAAGGRKAIVWRAVQK